MDEIGQPGATVELDPTHHPLQFPWTFTYFKKVANKSYEENTYTLGTTASVEDFWRLYVHLRRPVDERPTVCDYHVFREGIRPMWEDDANVNGGKWIVRLKKGLAARYWEDVVCFRPAPRLVPGCLFSPPPAAFLLPSYLPIPLLCVQMLAILGGQFRVGDEICGCVLSVRYQEDILSIWNRSADSRKVCMQIRDTMRSVMGLPENAVMEYKKHTDSMRDNSSYRNTNSNF